jgi:hypothetical protein
MCEFTCSYRFRSLTSPTARASGVKRMSALSALHLIETCHVWPVFMFLVAKVLAPQAMLASTGKHSARFVRAV